MDRRQPRYDMQEHVRRGKEMYERIVRPQVEAGNKGKVVALDIDTGAFAIGDDTLSASAALYARFPDAQGWCVRIGYPGVHRLGARAIQERP